MIQYELLRDRGILILKPEGALQADDFTALASAVDPYIEERGALNGLMIEAPSFPGWENFAALLSHLRFVRDHHRLIRRINSWIDFIAASSWVFRSLNSSAWQVIGEAAANAMATIRFLIARPPLK